jgi:hypothetical protein
MGIGAFGIDPASKFATEKRKTPKQKLTLLYLRIPLLGSGQLSGRVARGSTSRKAACGSAFRLFFHTVQGCRPAHLVRRHHMAADARAKARRAHKGRSGLCLRHSSGDLGMRAATAICFAQAIGREMRASHRASAQASQRLQ